MEQKKVSYRAGAIVINHKGQIALANEHLWGFPRGGVEEGEDYLATAMREVREEVGISEIESSQELGHYERYPNGMSQDTEGAYPMEIHMFLFLTLQEELCPGDPSIKETGWFSYDDACIRLSNDEDRKFLQNHREEIEKLTN
jgi:8-oxo-dGTP pyrophosphatase MutT (NUDIX family)